MSAVRAPVAALAALAVLSGCSTSPGTELANRARAAPPLDGYRVSITISDPSTIIGCFPDGGTLTIDVRPEHVAVYDELDDEPVLLANGADILLRPSAFSSGPDQWWTIDAATGGVAVQRVVGPVVTALALADDIRQPHRQIAALAATAASVQRIDSTRFQVIDRSAEPTIVDTTLDAHDHVEQLVVTAEDPRHERRADTTQTSYAARYRDTTEPAPSRPRDLRPVGVGQLDALDIRPGACDPVVAP